MPRAFFSGFVIAKSRQTSAAWPHVMNLLSRNPIRPSVPHGPGLLVGGVGARVGLGQGKAAELLSPRQRLEEPLLLVLVAVLLDRVADERVVDRQDDAGVRAGARNLLDHDGIGDDVHSRAPVLHGDGHSGEAELSRLEKDVLRKLARLVDPGGARAHDLLGKLPNAGLKESLILGQLEIHGAGEYTRRNPGSVDGRRKT